MLDMNLNEYSVIKSWSLHHKIMSHGEFESKRLLQSLSNSLSKEFEYKEVKINFFVKQNPVGGKKILEKNKMDKF